MQKLLDACFCFLVCLVIKMEGWMGYRNNPTGERIVNGVFIPRDNEEDLPMVSLQDARSTTFNAANPMRGTEGHPHSGTAQVLPEMLSRLPFSYYLLALVLYPNLHTSYLRTQVRRVCEDVQLQRLSGASNRHPLLTDYEPPIESWWSQSTWIQRVFVLICLSLLIGLSGLMVFEVRCRSMAIPKDIVDSETSASVSRRPTYQTARLADSRRPTREQDPRRSPSEPWYGSVDGPRLSLDSNSSPDFNINGQHYNSSDPRPTHTPPPPQNTQIYTAT